ncbi:A-kinase anchor protein 9-like isoform X2 [Harmonia axyridis]|uniref:A-kinase anchor protein 9-like isoform X2 n=1 Tax=Harmonia axyridis TaxID=115357 RepID=UPI001E2769EC|nr:A-kinase anchor protein 9-like isoform X2 [Harmonia axyridis]
MESSETDEVHENADPNATKITTIISIKDSDSSLSLSITPPSLGDGNKDEHTLAQSEDSISEHLSSTSTSIENDRSLNEIEIEHIPNFPLDIEKIEEESKHDHNTENSLSSHFQKENNAVNLPSLDEMNLFNSEQGEVKSILEEILNNDQFISDSESLSKKSKEDSFDIFANLDLEDKSLTERLMNQVGNDDYFGNEDHLDNASKQIEDLEELLDIKEQTIIALTGELDSFRDAVSNHSTISIGTSTEYKQLQDDYQNKFIEYNLAIQQKDDLILQLTESLQQSITNREELKTQVDHFKNELEHLHKQLETTSHMILKNEVKTRSPELEIVKRIEEDISFDLENTNFEIECSKLEETLGGKQVVMLNNIRKTINKHIDENKEKNEDALTKMKATMQEEKDFYEKEISRMKETLETMRNGNAEMIEIRQEIESKHQKEMEDLRRYFEQKCTDLEKNYSEEIFSQQSRKRSASITSSDNELPCDIPGLPSRPGPGGDAPSSLDTYRINYTKRALQNLSRTDLVNLKEDFKNLTTIFSKFDVENSSENDLSKLKDELGNFDVKNLFKVEMEAFRNEMKNKYNAELEILNQDYENKVDMLNVQQEEKLNSVRKKYLEEIDTLKDILNKTNKSLEYSCSVQEGNSGDFEINEVIQSYERRLQEQVTMAKIDIIAALENQIQRLAENEGSEEEWPQELLTLKERFTRKFEKRMAEMEEDHQNEMVRMKEEHMRSLNGALERARRRSLIDGDGLPLPDGKLIEERDNFKKQAGLLRKLLGELLKYFTQCEDEVNNTLVDELVRQASEKNFTDIERELNESTSSTRTDSSTSTVTPSVKRVHLAPNFKDLMSIVENSSEREHQEFSADLKNELESCLDKLKSEANALLALSVNVTKKSDSEDQADMSVGSLNRKLIEEVQLRMKVAEEADAQRNVIETMERERAVLEAQVVELIERLNVTQTDLEKTQMKMSGLLESGQREIVSEGYGGTGFRGEHEEGHAAILFDELQEKARTLLVGSQAHDPALLHLLEDLVGVGERILEEYNAVKKDLEQQIDVAHKKYKQTCRFLEEQASDREMERDESQRQILALQDQLKGLDRDRANYVNINEEQGVGEKASSTGVVTVEHLDGQLKETVGLLEVKDQKLKDVEAEKDEAVEKIFFLRDVIRELESQLKAKTETEADLRTLISDLEQVITQQTQEVKEKADASDDVDGSETRRYREQVRTLEAEVQKLRLSQELVGTEGALRELRNQLAEIETTIDKKTKELEDQSSIASNTTCSSPSEDMSVRDVVRPRTPTSLTGNDGEIPLQQLARLKEKLVRHARAEDAAMKRIRDLEMQVYNLKSTNEEHKAEKEILKKEISDQLGLISSLQIRLDDQRIRAEHIEKQTNSSLENKIYDLQREINDLQENLQAKNKTITNLSGLLEDMKQKMEDRESEASMASEDEMIITMQKEIEHLRNQNELLHKRLNTGVDIIPNLVENIISDKNSDIESLKQKLESAERQLEMYNSLNLDKSQISTLKSLKNSGTSLSEVLSIIELSSPDQARRMPDTEQDSDLINLIKRRPMLKNDTVFLPSDDVREISSIENLGGSNPHYLSITPLGKKNSTEVKSAERHVHFNISNKDSNQTEVKILIAELDKLRSELTLKDEMIKDCNEKLKTLTQLESNIDFFQSKLEETQHTLKDVTDNFQKEIENKEENEKDLRMDLVKKNMYLEEQEKELNMLREDAVRKDDMYLNLAKETKNLRKEKEVLEDKMKEFQEIEEILNVKNGAILELEKQVAVLKNKNSVEEQNLEQRLRQNEEQCESLKIRLESFSRENANKDQNIAKLKSDNEKLTRIVKIETENGEKLRKDLQNRDSIIEENEKKIKRLRKEIEVLKNEKADLKMQIEISKQELLAKETELSGKMEEGLVKTVEELEKKVLTLQLENSSKIDDLDNLNDKVRSLNEELGRYQDLVAEKDRIIARFRIDSEQLQANLKVIQNKMQENGNIIDLSKKLRDEQIKNSDLIEEIHMMKAQMMSYGMTEKDNMVASLEDIAEQVKKELDYSVEIDSNIINATEEIESVESNLESKYLELKERCREYQKSYKILQYELEKKRLELDTLQLEDGNLIEQLRIQLESATENELELETLAKSWKKQCQMYETEITKLKSQMSNTNSKSESTDYKNLPSKESQELIKLKKEVDSLNEQLAELKEENKGLKKRRKELENDLKYNKEMLEVKKGEVENLERKISNVSKREEELKERLHQKVKEVENSRFLIDDMERERKDMKLQMDRLNANLKQLEQEAMNRPIVPSSPHPEVPVADQLMSKIEELNFAVKNDKRTMDLILRLTNDNKNLKCKILELEKHGAVNVPSENHINRSNYLFAKCLRVESYRKALIWQKNYIVYLLGAYQDTTDLAPMDRVRRGQKKLRFSGIQKFRSYVYAIISLVRMKSIVRRWHSGTRFPENVNSRYKNISSELPKAQKSGPGNFKVGQPVSRQLFSPLARSSGYGQFDGNSVNFSGHIITSSESRGNESGNLEKPDDDPWSGDSPPCRDSSKNKGRISSNLTLLRAPHLLNQYAERYGKIEENLEALLNTDPSK